MGSRVLSRVTALRVYLRERTRNEVRRMMIVTYELVVSEVGGVGRRCSGGLTKCQPCARLNHSESSGHEKLIDEVQAAS